MNAVDAGIFLRALGDGSRLRVLSALARQPLTVGELSKLLQAPVQRVSRHLKYLEARGLVRWEPWGKSVRYHVTPPTDTLGRALWESLLAWLATVDEVRRDASRLGRRKRTAGRQE